MNGAEALVRTLVASGVDAIASSVSGPRLTGRGECVDIKVRSLDHKPLPQPELEITHE
jgi:hypothetical protein